MSENVLKKKDFYYDLPERLIAQDPLENRSSSRLLVLNKNTGNFRHTRFDHIIDYLKKGDCLVINNTKVIPARLIGVRDVENIEIRKGFDSPKPGAVCEVLLLKRLEDNCWEAIVKPGKKLKEGAKVVFGNGELSCTVKEVKDDGNRVVKFEFNGIFEEILDRLGTMPLPPYITHELKDKNRYQTVYAKYEGSAAAPTAGLHFTPELLEAIKAKGVEIAEVTLHVGLGTFRPVKEENVLDHKMHSEFYQVLESEAEKVNRCKANGGRIICVGTTSCRTVEAASTEDGILHAGCANTEIFIYPGYKFKVLDCLITNFHLPESTLIMLVSALAGRDNVLHAYEEAVKEEYRFFSFGDAMFVTDDEII
ncbi:MAG: tRNA preQ1(34) S-adenosylmethionine ribosyltransferase-isomerase QueA [Lachnospiraceae bacterium]|nr:tRNA preQ1(34) S-adenosylmethionine ribosyltransferase-isomerase QueA [Lachnospiraceae bacterium]